MIAVVFSALVGVFFGYYPALKASQLTRSTPCASNEPNGSFGMKSFVVALSLTSLMLLHSGSASAAAPVP